MIGPLNPLVPRRFPPVTGSRIGAGASAANRARELHAGGRRQRLIVRAAGAVLAAAAGWWLLGWQAALVLAVLAVVADTVRVARRWDDAAAWRKGARGERLTARLLRPLERAGYTVLHDRALPGSRANADHLVVGPHGIAVVDTKNWAKNTKIVGGRFAGGRVYIGRSRANRRLGGIIHETQVVTRVLERELGRPVDVVPVVAIHGARRMRWGALTVEGVTLLHARGAKRWIRRLPARYDAAAVAELARACERLFPPYAERKV
jgi:hypothetical protein